MKKCYIKEGAITTQLSKDVVLKEWRDSSIAEALIRATEIADFCAANATAIDYNGAFPKSEFELLAEAGLLAAPLHRGLGGWGAGIDANVTYELLMLLKQIGRGNEGGGASL